VKEEKLFEQNCFKSEQSSKMNKEVFFFFYFLFGAKMSLTYVSEQIISLMV
jgi:hypothetical protein